MRMVTTKIALVEVVITVGGDYDGGGANDEMRFKLN